MRRPAFSISWSATVVLLVVNVVAFLLQNILDRFSNFPTNAWFALSLDGLRHGFVWQLLSYQFMHGGLWHLLLNCWAIYVFGREVEDTLGRKSFLTLYFTSGVVGGLFQALAGLLLGRHFAVPVVGASAGAFGLVAAFAALYPERPITILVFIIPVTLKAKFLLIFEVLLAVFGIVAATDNVAHVAHLGGIMVGLAMVRWGESLGWPEFFRRRARPISRSRELAQVARSRDAGLGPAASPLDDLPPSEFISREVDPILDKISAQGIQSLTPRERRILEAATARIDKR